MADLQGKTIALLEARRASELAGLIARHGGVPYAAPALREAPLDNQPEVAAFLDRLVAGPVDIVVFLTGVGATALLQAAERMGTLEAVKAALQRAAVVARGPKPVAALRPYGLHCDVVAPEPNTTTEVLAVLRSLGLRDKVVAVQHYGERNLPLCDALLAEGAHLLEVSLYSWAMPEDPQPLTRFIQDVQRGVIAAVCATSQAQVANLFRLAEHFGEADALRRALNGGVVVVAVGPVCAAAWRAHGVAVDVEPGHPKMGQMVLALAAHLQLSGAQVR